jgi:hypothetical protein
MHSRKGRKGIGIWKEDGTMSEEYLFWDNQPYMNQLGIGK